MSRRRWMFACLALGALTLPATAQQRATALFPELPQADVRVVTTTGAHPFRVWIAADDASRQRGLMQVRELPAGHGMLFLFEWPRYVSFWMKDTYLSLDLIFIAEDGTVANIAAAATPLSLAPIPSARPVTAVLELLAGTAKRIGLEPGDRVEHTHFAVQ